MQKGEAPGGRMLFGDVGAMPGWRLIFRLAALFNFSVAIPLWAAPVWLSTLLGLEPVPTDILYTDLFAVLALTFGIGYWWVGADPVRNQVVLKMGICGKLLVVGVGYWHFFIGATNLPFALLVTGDLLWALVFWRFLWTHPEFRWSGSSA